MKLKDLKSKTTQELRELAKADAKKIAEIQFHRARVRSKNVKEIRELRRTRARIFTILKERS